MDLAVNTDPALALLALPGLPAVLDMVPRVVTVLELAMALSLVSMALEASTDLARALALVPSLASTDLVPVPVPKVLKVPRVPRAPRALRVLPLTPRRLTAPAF